MSETMSSSSAEVLSGKRCYDCGNLYETPLSENEDEQAKTDAEWVEQNPSHADCFK